MASQLSPIVTTESICSLETKCGAHKFTISGYSRHRGLGFGRYIYSARFQVGDHEWRIRYYPDGYGEETSSQQDYVGVQLELMSGLTKVRLEYDFRLAEEDAASAREATIIFHSPSPVELASEPSPSTCGTNRFMKKTELEESRFLWNDCVVIYCIVTVIKEPQLKETTAAASSTYRADVEIPPSNLSYDLGELLSSGKDADMSFKVKDDVFRAHKLIIDMRCPVLKAQFDEQITRDSRRTPDSSTIIEGMEPAVFKALLHFIYTDSLLDEHRKMVTDLFAAADRYAMERMKLYCGSILSDELTVQSVTTTIALAHKHSCSELKDACIQFIISSERRMADVFSSREYEELELNCPAVALQIRHKYEKFKVGLTGQVFEERRPPYEHGDEVRVDFSRAPKFDEPQGKKQ